MFIVNNILKTRVIIHPFSSTLSLWGLDGAGASAAVSGREAGSPGSPVHRRDQDNLYFNLAAV